MIGDTDYAADVERKLCDALRILNNKVLIELRDDTIIPQKQNEGDATYLLIGRLED